MILRDPRLRGLSFRYFLRRTVQINDDRLPIIAANATKPYESNMIMVISDEGRPRFIENRKALISRQNYITTALNKRQVTRGIFKLIPRI